MNLVAMVETEMHEVNLTETKKEQWLADSGASIHVTNDMAGLVNKSNTTEKVVLGDNTVIKADTKGTLYLRDPESLKTIMLKNVLYVPNFRRNILSLGRLVEHNNTSILMNSEFMMIINMNNQARIKVPKEVKTGLFVLSCTRDVNMEEEHQAYPIESSQVVPRKHHRQKKEMPKTMDISMAHDILDHPSIEQAKATKR